MPGRQLKKLDEVRRPTLLLSGLAHGLTVHADAEAAKQRDIQPTQDRSLPRAAGRAQARSGCAPG